MAESTENAIPNKKNSQKHVVIAPIDVHHRHDSQVSQILDPDKASDITKAQQRTSKVKKTQLSLCEITEPGKKFAFNRLVILLQLFIIKLMKSYKLMTI
ncbi:hypothetical protein TNCT_243101 [Trichonephila clavata]|uniref:Uncharacterized protein n=1 Tax=Trichonephila clavata TaxID=2740835 RepID=A0A8X6HTB7_TRICU|nr:hypothetical protein TNCT_243101 [Trichonephila clavata]